MASKTAAEPRNATASATVAYQWMCDSNHTPEARTLYAILAAHAGPNRVTGPRTPDRVDLSRILDLPLVDVDHLLFELETMAKWITPMWLPIYRRGVKKLKQVYLLNDAHLLAEQAGGEL